MPRSLLVLGGSGFVGRAVVDEGRRRGWEVTTFNRGRAAAVPGVSEIVGDRLEAATLASLRDGDWDVVVDTWSGAPRAVRDSAALLTDHAAHYVYISSGSVYAPPPPPHLELQLIDARDLASFVLGAAVAGHGGPFNVVSRRGHAAMRSLLEACHAVAGAPDARLTWMDPTAVIAAGIEPWTELPIWLPPDSEFAGMHAANVERAHAAGLHCRPVEQTVQDTWSWLSALERPPALRSDLDPPGLDRGRERVALDAWHARAL